LYDALHFAATIATGVIVPFSPPFVNRQVALFLFAKILHPVIGRRPFPKNRAVKGRTSFPPFFFRQNAQ